MGANIFLGQVTNSIYWKGNGEIFDKMGVSGESFWLIIFCQKKIDKRGRKLIDFDAERHSVQQMQNNPNRNEAKFVRAKVIRLNILFVSLMFFEQERISHLENWL